MQQFYGIPVTGVLDQTTIEWMKKPRCGVPDHPHLSRRRRNKRYALTGQKWRQKHITYRCLDSLSSSLALVPRSLCFSWSEFQRLTM
ncbi:Matrix metalloproteinase-24 [Saguinus oedipus]|uniref:Matrix metalloproteinase-24 n=1 Tax=Saguinus oedipus TaxID=9490 RepID=A0ABQ9VMT1_SAGOE|nr:Matrix metalloproteinase-24 [Saguinus oedipus]